MMMMVHRDDHGRPFPSSDGGGGPTSYDFGTAADTAGSTGEVLRGLQTFDTSNRTNTSAAAAAHRHITTFRSPGGMTTSLGFPFTNAQWKELERQAMVYKYMVASLPIPRDLLFPIARASSGAAVTQSPVANEFNLRLTNSGDPEPGRCKRTDGKKWRCSKDVAPEQKYCERHLHRGRPRSRKHVEGHATTTVTNTKKARRDINQPPPPPLPTAVSVSTTPTTAINQNVCPTQFVESTAQAYHEPLATFDSMNSASSDRDLRNLAWGMMEGPSVQISDPQWHHQLSSKIPFFDANPSVFGQRSEEDCFLNLNSYTNFNAGDDQEDGHCNLYLNPDVASLENPLLEETPRCFIDAWSKTMVDDANSNRDNNRSAPSSRQLSPSSLTLSMGGYNSINEDMGMTDMSLRCNGDSVKPRNSTWLTPASSWSASAPGGPLAEVLKPTTSAASTPPSPITTGNTNGDLSSPVATTTTTVSSSPSGVLQKTFASLSDSSGSSSPTLASSKWLNQKKA